MNRRGFLTGLAAGIASFAILPSAATYARKWVLMDNWFWESPEYHLIHIPIRDFFFEDTTVYEKVQFPNLIGRWKMLESGEGGLVSEPLSLPYLDYLSSELNKSGFVNA